jgi:carboxylesterase
MYPWTLPAVRMVKLFTPVLPTIREDVRDARARRSYTRDVYRWTPMAPVLSMLRSLPILRKELPSITTPVLVFAAVHDHVVPVRDGLAIYRLLGSSEKQLVILHRSYHVVMKDHDRDEVMQKTLSFVQKHAHQPAERS